MKDISFRQKWKIIAGIVLVIVSWGPAWGADERTEAFVSHELLVKYHGWAEDSEKSLARDVVNAELIREVKILRVEYWKLPESVDTLEAEELISSMPAVEYAEPNYLYSPQITPDDTHFNRLWYLENNGQQVNTRSGVSGADISAPKAWDLETGSSSIVIAVIDSGVAFDHPDLKNNIWHNADEIPDNGRDDDNNGFIDDLCGWDFVNNDNNPSDYSKDLYGDGHGTHVAGIIAAEGNNGIGATGVMWHAQIMPVQIFDLFEDSPFNATTLVVLESILYAVENGADIINCSFGGPSFSQALYEAYRLAGEHDILVVAAAGNDASDNDIVYTYPASYVLDNIISVAATDENDFLAAYSNYGKRSVDVAAPGGSGNGSNIYNTTPPPRELIFSDDFESRNGVKDQWVTGGEFESWTTVYDNDFNSTVVIDSAGDYHENENSYIRTADPIQTKNFRGLNFRLGISYSLERRYDNLKIELSEGKSGEYETINTITGFSLGIERLLIWSNDTEFDNFYLRFSLISDHEANYDGVYIDDVTLSGIKWEFTGNEYGYKSGTSMATPVVAGIAGLVWSANSGLSCVEVKEIIAGSVDRIPNLAGRLISEGRVNAEAAVMSAISSIELDPGPGDVLVPDDVPEPDPESKGSDGDSGCFIFVLVCQ